MLANNPIVILQLLHLLQLRPLYAQNFVHVEFATAVVSVEILLSFVIFVYLTRTTRFRRTTQM
jgi:hypothetical protein